MHNYPLFIETLIENLDKKREEMLIIEKLLLDYQKENPQRFENFMNYPHFEVSLKKGCIEIVSMKNCCGGYIPRYKMLIYLKKKKILIVPFDK